MKNIFKETVKDMKRAISKDRLFIQFKDETAYISDGHYICKMPVIMYNYWIFTSVPGIPAYSEGDSYTIEKDRPLEKSGIDLTKIIKESRYLDAVATEPTPILMETGDRMARAFIYDMNGITTGTLINEVFVKISQEYTDNTYYCAGINRPVYTSKNGLACLMLPINYKTSYLDTIITAMNKAKETAKKSA